MRARSRSWRGRGCLGGCLLLVGGCLLHVVGAPRAAAARPAAELKTLSPGVSHVTISPDGRWAAYLRREGSPPAPRYAIVVYDTRADREAHRLSRCRSALQIVAWAADSRRVAYLCDSQLTVAHVPRGPVHAVGRLEGFNEDLLSRFGFGPEGAALYLATPWRLYRYRWPAGQPRPGSRELAFGNLAKRCAHGADTRFSGPHHGETGPGSRYQLAFCGRAGHPVRDGFVNIALVDLQRGQTRTLPPLGAGLLG